MNIGQLKQAIEESGLPDHAEVRIEDDAADLFGLGSAQEGTDSTLILSTGDLIEED